MLFTRILLSVSGWQPPLPLSGWLPICRVRSAFSKVIANLVLQSLIQRGLMSHINTTLAHGFEMIHHASSVKFHWHSVGRRLVTVMLHPMIMLKSSALVQTRDAAGHQMPWVSVLAVMAHPSC